MSPAPYSDFNADGPMQDDGAAQVIARAVRSVRFVEALRRLEAEGIGLGPGVLTLMQRYADGALRLPELVAQARARMQVQTQMQMQAPGATRRGPR